MNSKKHTTEFALYPSLWSTKNQEALGLFLEAKCTRESERWGGCIWQSNRLTINSCSSSGSSLIHITSSASCFTYKNNQLRDIYCKNFKNWCFFSFCFPCYISLANYEMEKNNKIYNIKFKLAQFSYTQLYVTRYTHFQVCQCICACKLKSWTLAKIGRKQTQYKDPRQVRGNTFMPKRETATITAAPN